MSNLRSVLLSYYRMREMRINNIIRRKRSENIRHIVQQLMVNVSNNFIASQQIDYSFITRIIKPKFRRFWKKQRSVEFWEKTVLQNYIHEDFVESFRMSRDTFEFLCSKLEPFMKPHPAPVRQPIPLKMKVAMSLYKLASCCEYRVVGNVFGVHKSTVQKCLYAFVNAINNFTSEIIYLPDLEEAGNIADEVERKTGVPQIFGFIDGTHIPILPPSEGYKDFINRKGWPSLILQAVVDNKYLFRDISINFPGSCHDALVFKNSKLFLRAKTTIPTGLKMINDSPIPFMLIGDPAYPLLPWLMKGYVGKLSEDEESFNAYLSSSRIAVENAFGRLKGRWRCLSKKIDINYKFVPKIVCACCILHNLVEKRGERFNSFWLNSIEENSNSLPQPTQRAIMVNNRNEDVNMKQIRDVLKEYMFNNFPHRTSTRTSRVNV